MGIIGDSILPAFFEALHFVQARLAALSALLRPGATTARRLRASRPGRVRLQCSSVDNKQRAQRLHFVQIFLGCLYVAPQRNTPQRVAKRCNGATR